MSFFQYIRQYWCLQTQKRSFKMKLIRKNKQAYFNYEIVDTLEAWIVLLWHEVKSIKFWNCTVNDAIITFTEKELRLVNCSVSLYERTNPVNAQWYDPKQRRKLLITKQQLARIYSKTRKTWLHIVPLEIYETKWRIKVKVWLGKLKKKVEKRSALKEKDTKRMMDKEIKNYR